MYFAQFTRKRAGFAFLIPSVLAVVRDTHTLAQSPRLRLAFDFLFLPRRYRQQAIR